MKSEISTRLAGTRDRRTLVALDPLAEKDLQRRETIDSAMAARRCWVAEGFGRVVGYGILSRNFFHRDFIEIVFVAEDARRTGEPGRGQVGQQVVDSWRPRSGRTTHRVTHADDDRGVASGEPLLLWHDEKPVTTRAGGRRSDRGDLGQHGAGAAPQFMAAYATKRTPRRGNKAEPVEASPSKP